MPKPSLPLTLLALAPAFLGVPGPDRRPEPRRLDETPREALRLKEEAMTIEYLPAIDEATLVMSAESEASLNRIQLVRPDGRSVLRMQCGDDEALELQGYNLEAREVGFAQFLRNYPAGRYDVRAWTVDGQVVTGHAILEHGLLREPAVLYPTPGAEDVPTNLTVGWLPVEGAVAYQVTLEQNENDGLVVRLPADSGSLVVPPGVLAPGTESHVEVGAIGANGNRTLVEVEFTTGS